MNNEINLSDQNLLELIANGDKKAFEEIYNRYWPTLFLQINRMVQDQDESIDIVQSIFEKIWRNTPRDVNNIQAYLYQMGRYASINFINKSSRKQSFVDDFNNFQNNLADSITDKIHYSDVLKILYKEIENLPPKMKEIFIRARIKNDPYKLIAEEMNISIQTVKTTVLRVSKTLRKKIPYIKIFFIN